MDPLNNKAVRSTALPSANLSATSTTQVMASAIMSPELNSGVPSIKSESDSNGVGLTSNDLRLKEKELDSYKSEIRRLRHQVTVFQSENEQRRNLVNRFGPDWDQNPTSHAIGGTLNKDCLNCPTFLELERSEANVSLWEEKFRQAEEEKVSLLKENAELKVQLGKPLPNPSNSGISPSKHIGGDKNISKDEKDEAGKPIEKKKRGGQKGHAPHFRQPFSDDEADVINDHKLEGERVCPDCGTELVRDGDSDLEKCQYDANKPKLVKIKHKIWGYRCPNCGKIHRPNVSPEIYRGMMSPYLLVWLVLMKNLFHLSMGKIQVFFERHFDLKIAVSYVNKSLKAVSLGLRPIYLEALDSIKKEKFLNIDETVFKCGPKRAYVWAFLGRTCAAFTIRSRAGANLTEAIGDVFEGVITSDCYGPYISYAKNHKKVALQLCLEHLKRDLQRCADWITNKEVSEFGEKGVEIVQLIFHLHKLYKEKYNEDMYGAETLKYLSLLKEQEEKLVNLCVNAPTSYSKSRGIAERFKDYPQYYFVFLDNPEIDPTNNAAERAVRGIVLERKVSYGTKGLNGNMSCEVLWTIRDTAKLRGIDLVDFLLGAVTAKIKGEPLPSLVNLGQPVAQKYVDQAKREKNKIKVLNKASARSRKTKEAKEDLGNALGRSAKFSENEPKPTPPVSEAKTKPEPKPAPPVSEAKTKPEPKPAPPVSEAKPKPEPKPAPPILEEKPEPEPLSSTKKSEANSGTLNKESQQSTDDASAPYAPNPPNKGGKRLKRMTANPSAKSGQKPRLIPLVMAPESRQRESGASPKGSHSYASPNPGASLACQGGRSAPKPEIKPGAKGRGASRKTLKKSASSSSQDKIR